MPTAASSKAAYQEIVDNAKAELIKWQTVEHNINSEINTIKDGAWNRKLTPAERERISDLRSDKAAALDAIEELGFVTLGALDKSDELKRLVNALSAVRADLDSRRQRIEKFAAKAQKISGMIASLDSIVKKVDNLQKTIKNDNS